MARYHFHASDGVVLRDEEGEHLPDLEAAKDVAVDVLAEMLPMHREGFWRHKVFSVTVNDHAGRMMAVVTATATVNPVSEP